MARLHRITPAGSVQHVISRFVNRSYLLDYPGARGQYATRLANALEQTDWLLLAYALMSSHIHLVLIAGQRPLESLTKRVHVGFAAWLNRKSNRLGPVFASRPRSVTVHGDSAAALVAYVHNNPVRAAVVSEAAQSTWTSHRAYLGVAPCGDWLDVRAGLRMCCFSPDAADRRAFDAFVGERANELRNGLFCGDGNARARRTVRAAVAAPVELSTPFVRSTGDPSVERLMVATPNTPIHIPRAPEPMNLLRTVSRVTRVPLEELRSRSRRQQVTDARRVALFAWNRHFGKPAIELARVLGISASSASELLATATSGVARRAAAVVRAHLG